MKIIHITSLVAACWAIASLAHADEFAIRLTPGVGVDQTSASCAACHSLDYIVMNSPFPTAPVWDAEVKKMINVFGADIKPDDAKIITEYLAKNYGG